MISNAKLTTALTLALAAVAFSGCIGDAGGNSSLYVKDDLTEDVAEVHVTFTKAQVQHADGIWQTVFDGKQTIDLLALSSASAKESLSSFDLAAGSYDGLRIMVSEVEVVNHDGSRQSLNVFGNIVEVADEFTVGADGIDILVDFDLDEGVDMAAGEYTPVVKNVQTSDDDADNDGIHDVDDTDDDDDGRDDNDDDDIDGDGNDDKPAQSHRNLEQACAAERDEEIADAAEERDEEIAEAAEERDQAYADADAKRQEAVLSGNVSDAQAQYENDTAEADREYDEAVAEANAEYDEEVAEAEEEHSECLAEGLDDDSDDDDDEEDDSDDDDDDE